MTILNVQYSFLLKVFSFLQTFDDISDFPVWPLKEPGFRPTRLILFMYFLKDLAQNVDSCNFKHPHMVAENFKCIFEL